MVAASEVTGTRSAFRYSWGISDSGLWDWIWQDPNLSHRLFNPSPKRIDIIWNYLESGLWGLIQMLLSLFMVPLAVAWINFLVHTSFADRFRPSSYMEQIQLVDGQKSLDLQTSWLPWVQPDPAMSYVILCLSDTLETTGAKYPIRRIIFEGHVWLQWIFWINRLSESGSWLSCHCL